jgi:iron-sulfur cluster repair protein YtfE (RIC family)
MLRDKNLIPLSHQHQRALALCVRIDRASPVPDSDLDAWQAEVAQLFRTEGEIHFAAEERVLFREASRFPELDSLIDELLTEHADLRNYFSAAEARTMSAEDLNAFAKKLSAHIRKEERQLFERMQALMTAEELAALGKVLEGALKDAAYVCALPNATTALREKRS